MQMWQGLTLSVLNATWPACSFVNAAVTSFVMLPLLGFGMMPRGPCIQIPADARPRALHCTAAPTTRSPRLPYPQADPGLAHVKSSAVRWNGIRHSGLDSATVRTAQRSPDSGAEHVSARCGQAMRSAGRACVGRQRRRPRASPTHVSVCTSKSE